MHIKRGGLCICLYKVEAIIWRKKYENTRSFFWVLFAFHIIFRYLQNPTCKIKTVVRILCRPPRHFMQYWMRFQIIMQIKYLLLLHQVSNLNHSPLPSWSPTPANRNWLTSPIYCRSRDANDGPLNNKMGNDQYCLR